jgi:hypothetical protein
MRRLGRRAVILMGVAALGGCASRPARLAPMVSEPTARPEVIVALERAAAAAKALPELTCRFHRFERYNGRYGTRQEMEVKFRRRPYSLYLRWVDPGKRGSEMLFVAGRDEDRIIGHLGGPLGWLFPTMRLRLDDPFIISASRHSIYEFDPEVLATRLLADVRRADLAGHLEAARLGTGDVHGDPAVGFQIAFSDAADYYAPRLRLWFNAETGLVSASTAYDADGRLLEDYAFVQVRAARFTDLDFDPANPAYDFGR